MPLARKTLISWGIRWAAQRLMPRAELRIFAAVGHNIPTELPGEFNQAVLGFLSR